MRFYRSQRRAKLKNDQKANEPLQEAVFFVVKRRACRGRILRRSHIAAQKILAHVAQYASVLRRRGKYCRAHVYFRAHLTFNAVRPPVFLSFFPCKECASVNMPALFCHASAFLPALICFSDYAPACAQFFSDYFTAFPLFIFGCIPVFSDIKRTLINFYAFFIRASFAYGRAGSIFGRISCKMIRFFVRIRPGTLVLCSFVGFSAFLPCANGKISPKILKKGFFQAFLSRFERNKNPRKSLEKSMKNDRRKTKNGCFLAKSGFFGLSKKPLRRFQTEFFLKSSKNPTPKRLKNGFWKDFLAVSG